MRTTAVVAIVSSLAFAAMPLQAAEKSSSSSPTKDECLEAHGRGQDLRDKGQLVRSRQAFTTCAQSACPTVVQSDCARLNEEISHLVPTVTFAARDASGTDLPVTSVYVDESLMTTRLDDGRTYEVDPGKHMIRYSHDGHETTNKVVLNQGEKGRVLVATFAATLGGSPSSSSPNAGGASRSSSASGADSFEPVIESKRSGVPLVFAGIGAAAAVTGGVLTGLGIAKVPASCSMSTNECATSANDPAIGEAKSGASLANAGISIGVGGLLVLTGSLIWYWVQPAQREREAGKREASSLSPRSVFLEGMRF